MEVYSLVEAGMYLIPKAWKKKGADKPTGPGGPQDKRQGRTKDLPKWGKEQGVPAFPSYTPRNAAKPLIALLAERPGISSVIILIWIVHGYRH